MLSMQLGVIGLGTMGANLARNAAHNGADVVVYNRTTEKTEAFMAAHGAEGQLKPTHSLQDFVSALHQPRRILLMVKAGEAVDAMIEELLPLIAQGDIIIDAGNSHYKDSERRETYLRSKGVWFVAMGISGGEEGALRGPSMMPGGDRSAVNELMPLFKKMAASDGSAKGKCVGYVGPGGAGHFVKIVHNGIEYGDMQLISEAYHLLSQSAGLGNGQLAAQFNEWNQIKTLRSYLIEITAKIFVQKDELAEGDLIDVILDAADQKGTGRWTTEAALDLGVSVPTITAAVDARILSALKTQRMAAALKKNELAFSTANITPQHVESALILSKICSYAQGLALITQASKAYGWNIDIAEVCRLWKGGCIIRSAMLGTFEKVLRKEPSLTNILLSDSIFRLFRSKHRRWRKAVGTGLACGIPLPAMTASLSYFDASFTARLPQNLVQAQRDFFGAHTYKRTDREGLFHTQWQ